MYKKLNQQGFHHVLMVALIVVVVAGIGFAGWYVWNMNKDTNKTLESVGNADSTSTATVPTATPASTSISAAATVTENELDTLRTFCLGTNPDALVGSLQYVENRNGNFGLCTIGSKTDEMAGAMLVAAYENGAWVRVWSGNGSMDLAECTAHKLPSTIYADCIGFYE